MPRAHFAILLLAALAAPEAAAQEAPLTVGVRQAAPFAIREPDGSWRGISVELWDGIARRLGVDYELREVPDLGALRLDARAPEFPLRRLPAGDRGPGAPPPGGGSARLALRSRCRPGARSASPSTARCWSRSTPPTGSGPSSATSGGSPGAGRDRHENGRASPAHRTRATLARRTVKHGDWQDYPLHGEGGHHTVSGTLKVLPGLESPRLGNRRDVLAYLPPSYGRNPRRRYPVLYMHDGQNLFDAATSFSGEWRVDETLEEASRAGMEAIVVGVPNAGEARIDEYSPFADPRHGGGRGDLYLDFLVHTLKPIVDRDFRTLPRREYTGIAGSSMGALISLYAFFRHPRVFGFVGAMSPAFWFAQRAIFAAVRAAPYVPGRIYLDVGTREGPATLRDARAMRSLLHARGYDAEHELRYVEEPGAPHAEAAWARRLRGALEFLLPSPGRRLDEFPASAIRMRHVLGWPRRGPEGR